jgi:hypothetical protein
MKCKNLICLALVFLIVFSVFAAVAHFINAQTQTAPIISIVPKGEQGATSITIIPAQSVGSNFYVNVRVDNYADVNLGSTGAQNGVSGASYVVTWNPAVLEFVNYTDGAWLPDQSNPGDLSNYVADGNLTIGQIAFDTTNPFATADSSAGSVSATLNFTVVSTGTSTIGLEQQGASVPYLVAPETVGSLTSGHAVPNVTAVNAQYGSSTSPSPGPSPSPAPTTSPTPTPTPSSSTHGPTAIISNQNGTTYETGEQILLDGSSSTPGYDATSAESCPITNYAWLVQYENNSVFGAFSGSGVTIVVNSAGWLQVTLIVTAPDVNTSPNPQYTNTSLASVWINVQPPQQLAKIVLTSSQAVYAPQQLVQLYAYVTFNGASEANENVVFTVLSPNGTVISIRTAFTNSTGYASQSYVTPNIGTSNFGTWTVIASVEVAQVVVTDKITFEYNYLVTVTINGITLPSSVARGGTMTIKVSIQNTDGITLGSTVAITIYDQNDVPIGSSLSAVSNAASGASVSETFTIPTWAYVGEATVYVNILTGNPASGGVPLSPERTANFLITP